MAIRTGFATTMARHLARETATLSRYLLYRNSMCRGKSCSLDVVIETINSSQRAFEPIAGRVGTREGIGLPRGLGLRRRHGAVGLERRDRGASEPGRQVQQRQEMRHRGQVHTQSAGDLGVRLTCLDAALDEPRQVPWNC
jgi:hypothetical protein